MGPKFSNSVPGRCPEPRKLSGKAPKRPPGNKAHPKGPDDELRGWFQVR